MKPWLVFFILLSGTLNFSLQAQSRGISLEKISIETRTPYAGGFYRALIIRNNIYQDKTGPWPSLKTAVSDARAVTDLLSEQYGFDDIEMLENASRRDVLNAQNRLLKKRHYLMIIFWFITPAMVFLKMKPCVDTGCRLMPKVSIAQRF